MEMFDCPRCGPLTRIFVQREYEVNTYTAEGELTDDDPEFILNRYVVEPRDHRLDTLCVYCAKCCEEIPYEYQSLVLAQLRSDTLPRCSEWPGPSAKDLVVAYRQHFNPQGVS